MFKKGLLSCLLAGAIFLTVVKPVFACDLNDGMADCNYNYLQSIKPPQCEPSQVTYGLCLNPNLKEALLITKSPSFRETINQVVQDAETYLDTITPGAEKLIIADLDETLVDNSEYYSGQKSFNPESWSEWLRSGGEGPYIEPVLEFLKKAKKKGFSVMFITGRSSEQARDTLAQVTSVQWDGVYFRTAGKSSRIYKAAVRQMLRQLGYEIVLNLGDQFSDFDPPVDPLEGEFMLPNVLYSIP